MGVRYPLGQYSIYKSVLQCMTLCEAKKKIHVKIKESILRKGGGGIRQVGRLVTR